MKIILFGSNGMLGTYLNSYLSPNYDVVRLTRTDLDLSTVTAIELSEYLSKFISKGDVIINAAGVIKQREYDPLDMIMVNTVFPNLLGLVKEELGFEVIHITTDCVYSGLEGGYDENSKPDCTDDYGQSKSLGEHANLTNIRTSIIGEEKTNHKSLLEWVRSNKGKEIGGYVNHHWNGLTCLELAKQIELIIQNNSFWVGVKHYHSPDTVNKYDLVSMINDIYKLGITINPTNTPQICHRGLSSINQQTVTKTLFEQIIEMSKYKI
jgi:dTDP-4-dehydrorhamnose reductase